MDREPTEPRRRKPPKRITARYLRWHTERYLSRYTTTTSHLKRLLMRRVHRAATYHEVPVEPWEALVDAEIARLVEMGLLDDALFARSKARSLHRRGNPARAIRAKLAAKGLRGQVVDDALEALAASVGDLELAAACTWARKRRLGPWARERSDDRELRQKHLAKFGRAGFSYGVATKVLDAQDPEDLGAPY